MGQFASRVPPPTEEERTAMLQLLGGIANLTSGAQASPAFTKEQVAFLYSPEYVPPNSDCEIIILTVVVLLGLVASISLRFYSRWRFGAQSGPLLDDWLVLVATVSCITHSLVNLYGFIWLGYGRNSYDLSIERFNGCLKLFIVNICTFAVANTAVKVSILVLYRRIFDSMQTKMRRVVYILISMIILFCPISIIVQIFSCTPVWVMWHLEARLDPNVKCNYGAAGSYIIGVIRTLFDIIIFVLPLKHIWSIHSFTKQKKIAITGIFTLGLIACIAAIFKLALYPEWLRGDIIRGLFKPVAAECVEYTAAIIAACIPALLPMLKTAYRNTTSTIRQITSGGRSHIQSTTTHIGTSPHAESIKLKGIKVSHAVSQTIEVRTEEEDDMELILQRPGDDKEDQDSKNGYHWSQKSV